MSRIQPPPSRPTRRRTRHFGWWLGALGLIGFPVLIYLGYWYVNKSRFDWVIRRGQELLATAHDPATSDAALRQWDAATSRYWQLDRERLIDRLLAFGPETDIPARRMLTFVAGVDYGGRATDWERWAEDRRQLRRGRSPKVPAKEQVRLEERWRADIGLTAWFTTILPIDEQIFIASLGAGWEMPDDPADGIVRVDGRTGDVRIFFPIPASEKTPRDVVGISAGDDCLFAALRNGSVFCVERDGQIRWRSSAGGVPVSPPMSHDVNKDGVTDVILCTSAGRLICLNGATGRTIWNAVLGSSADLAPTHFPAAIQPGLYVFLAIGDVTGGGAKEIVVTTGSGKFFVASPHDGRVIWKYNGAYGFAAGGVQVSDRTNERGSFFACDFQGQVWSISRGARELSAVMRGYTPLPAEGGVCAALRTAPNGAQLLGGWLIAAGGDDEHDGRVTLLGTPERDWIYTLPGMIPTTPAVADLNGDGAPETVVASRPRPGTAQIPTLLILSAEGHMLRRLNLAADVLAAPVVADVDGDGKVDLLIADSAGVLHCLATRQAGPISWGLFGGDIRNTRSARNAYEYSQTPSGYQWRWRPK